MKIEHEPIRGSCGGGGGECNSKTHRVLFCFVFVLLLLLKIETRDYFGLWKMVTQRSV